MSLCHAPATYTPTAIYPVFRFPIDYIPKSIKRLGFDCIIYSYDASSAVHLHSAS